MSRPTVNSFFVINNYTTYAKRAPRFSLGALLKKLSRTRGRRGDQAQGDILAAGGGQGAVVC